MGPTSGTRGAGRRRAVVRRPALAAGLAVLLALTVVGCSDDDDGGDADATTSVSTTEATTTAGDEETAGPGEGTTESSAPSGTSAVERPPVGSCVDVPEAADGLYVVADAGTAVVTREGDRLTVGEVVANEGWTSSVEIDDDGDVDVDFERGREEVWLEVEIVGGEVRAKVCADD